MTFMRAILALWALFALAGLPGAAQAASNLVVNCHDEARDTVQSKLSGDCKGKVVSDAEAAVIKERRKAYIKRALNKKPAPATAGKRLRGVGSGFFVAADGSLVTNHHVIANCAQVMVSSAMGESGAVTAIESDPENDLALLRTDMTPRDWANFAAITQSIPRRPVALVGYPSQGLAPINPRLTQGFFLAIRQRSPTARVLVFEADVRKGNSGGPLLDSEGKVIGVTFAQLNSVGVFEKTGTLIQDIGFAILLEDVLAFLERHGVAYRMERSPASQGEETSAEDTAAQDPKAVSEAMLQAARPYMARIGCWG